MFTEVTYVRNFGRVENASGIAHDRRGTRTIKIAGARLGVTGVVPASGFLVDFTPFESQWGAK